MRDFNITRGDVYDKNDADSVAAWIECTRSDEFDNNIVRFVKFQGESSPAGVLLETNDFMLVIISNIQVAWMKFGNRMQEVALDSTHGSNEYHFQLTTLLLIDENCEGIPVQHIYFTPRKDYSPSNYYI